MSLLVAEDSIYAWWPSGRVYSAATLTQRKRLIIKIMITAADLVTLLIVSYQSKLNIPVRVCERKWLCFQMEPYR